MIRQTRGVWVIDGDTCHLPWIEQSGRLDHDLYAREILVPLLRHGDTVIDVGAHWGTHTRMYLDAVGPEGLVVAYEPHQESFECLIRNCEEALPFCLAVGGEAGKEWMTLDPFNSGASHFGFGTVSNRVEVTTLDEHSKGWIANPEPLRLIKVDCEGAEPEVLEGATGLIMALRPYLYVEVNPPALARRGHSAQNLKEMLEWMMYRVEFFPPSSDWSSPQSDVLCTPR